MDGDEGITPQDEDLNENEENDISNVDEE